MKAILADHWDAPAAPPSDAGAPTAGPLSPVLARLMRSEPGECLACRAPITRYLGVLYCDPCAEKLWAVKRARMAYDTLLSECYQQGWIERSTLRCSFALSQRRYEQADAYASARAWRPGSSNVYIQGDIGSGKSYLGRCLLNASLRAGMTVAECTALEFTKAVANFYQARGVAWLYGPGVVLMDDLDKAPWSETTLGWLWQLLDKRRVLRRATVVTSNFDTDGLRRWLEGRAKANKSLPTAILDRLRPCTALTLAGTSLRRRERAWACDEADALDDGEPFEPEGYEWRGVER